MDEARRPAVAGLVSVDDIHARGRPEALSPFDVEASLVDVRGISTRDLMEPEHRERPKPEREHPTPHVGPVMAAHTHGVKHSASRDRRLVKKFALHVPERGVSRTTGPR
jgi:hypothetical protein